MAVSDEARAVVAGVVTPLRVLFLVAIVAAAVDGWRPVHGDEARGHDEAG